LKSLPQAILFFRSGDYDQSAQLFNGILESLPDERQAASAAALLHLGEAGNYRQLLSRLYSNLGVCRLRARRYEEAVRNLERDRPMLVERSLPRLQCRAGSDD